MESNNLETTRWNDGADENGCGTLRDYLIECGIVLRAPSVEKGIGGEVQGNRESLAVAVSQ